MTPYYSHGGITIYHGDCRDFLLQLDRVDVVIADPPYGETNLEWDRWQENWLLMGCSNSLWSFGTLRMFMDHHSDFRKHGWKLAQDLIWEKHNGSGLLADRFRRVHEQVAHFYKGKWADVWRNVQMTADATARTVRRKQKPTHWSKIKSGHYVSIDGGPRMMRSVLRVRSEHSRAVHPTQKPLGILRPIIDYSCPPTGILLDPFMGSGSTLVAAKEMGRHAIGIEINEKDCENAAQRLSQEVMVL